MEQQDISTLLGMQLDEVLKSPFVRSLRVKPKMELIHDRFHMDLPRAGVAFIASLDGRASSIQLYAAQHDGYAQFAGEVPDGVVFSDSRESVRRRLGKPSASGGGGKVPVLGEIPSWDRFDRHGYFLHVEYAKGNAAVNMITLMRPDAVPK